MKLVVLLSRIPYPLEKGDKLRAFHQIVELSKFHDIYLLALNKGHVHPDAQNELLKYCKEVHFFQLTNWSIFVNVVKAFYTFKPLQLGYFYSSSIKRNIHLLIETIRPDHLYCQLIRTSDYIKKLDISKTIDYQDVFSVGMKRRAKQSKGVFKFIYAFEAQRLTRYERFVFPFFNHHTIISQADQELMPIAKKDTIEVIPNGVDFLYFHEYQRDKEFDIVFTGNMSYAPNVKAAKFLIKEIMPLVWSQHHSCKVLIAGANPHSSLIKLQNEKVVITGWVRDIRECYAKSKVFVAPMQIGTGLQNKLLEAMAMKIPCVTSELANKALMAIPNLDVRVGTNPEQFASHILDLIENPNKCELQVESAYQFVLKNYSWKQSVQKLNELFSS